MRRARSSGSAVVSSSVESRRSSILPGHRCRRRAGRRHTTVQARRWRSCRRGDRRSIGGIGRVIVLEAIELERIVVRQVVAVNEFRSVCVLRVGRSLVITLGVLTLRFSSTGSATSPHTRNPARSIPFERNTPATANQHAARSHCLRAQCNIPAQTQAVLASNPKHPHTNSPL